MANNAISGYIDSATIYDVVTFFSADKLGDQHRWSWENALTVTAVLINLDNFGISPAPSSPSEAKGMYKFLTDKISAYLSNCGPPVLRKSSVLQANSWAKQNTSRILEIYARLKNDEQNFVPWRDWAIKFAWLEHSSRLNGLFNENFIRTLSIITGVSISNLKKLHRNSKETGYVEAHLRSGGSKELYSLLIDCYILSGLIRGVGHYIDASYAGSEFKIIQHQFRRDVILEAPPKDVQHFECTTVENFLFNIVIAGSFNEKTIEGRIELWVRNLAKVKNAIDRGEINLYANINRDPLLFAIDLAQKIRLDFNRRNLEILINSLVSGGMFAAAFALWSYDCKVLETKLGIMGGAGLSVGALSYLHYNDSKYKIMANKYYLRELAEFEPGQVRTVWG